jgi:hypothetical protein
MASANLPDQRAHDGYERTRFRSEPNELGLLREENKQLKELVVHLSQIVVKNALEAK